MDNWNNIYQEAQNLIAKYPTEIEGIVTFGVSHVFRIIVSVIITIIGVAIIRNGIKKKALGNIIQGFAVLIVPVGLMVGMVFEFLPKEPSIQVHVIDFAECTPQKLGLKKPEYSITGRQAMCYELDNDGLRGLADPLFYEYDEDGEVISYETITFPVNEPIYNLIDTVQDVYLVLRNQQELIGVALEDGRYVMIR